MEKMDEVIKMLLTLVMFSASAFGYYFCKYTIINKQRYKDFWGDK